MSDQPQVETQIEEPVLEHSTYGATAMRGATWIGGAAIIAKSASFCAQWALGWLLSQGDFALWALALSSSAIVMALRNAGIGRILIQRGDEFADLARPFLIITFCLNLALGVFLASAALPLAQFYDESQLPMLIWILAFSFPLSTLSVILLSKVSIDLRFKTQARIGAVSAILRHGGAVSFALLGFGPVSFVLPLLLVPIYETIASARVVGWIPRGNPPTWRLVGEIFHASKWIILGTAGASMVLMGDYLVIGKLAPAVLGLYFFGFQLAESVTVVFSTPLFAVLLPSLVKIRHDRKRLAIAYEKALRIVCLVGAPISIGLATIADPLVRILWWDGRWNGAIPVVIVVSLSVAFRLQRIVGISVFEVHGKWKTWSVHQIIQAIGVALAAVCGALTGGLLSIVIWVSTYRVLISIVQCLHANRESGVTSFNYFKSTIPGVVSALICGAVAYSLFTLIFPLTQPVVQLTAIGATFAALYAGFAMVVMRDDINLLRAMVLARKSRS